MSALAFYKLSIIVALSSGATLSLVGKHYFSRGSILEIFLLSQLALLGNLIAKLVLDESTLSWSALVVSYLFFGLGKWLLTRLSFKDGEQGTFMVGGYLVLISLQHLFIGIFPQLEAHHRAGFFGNTVTATKTENLSMIFTTVLFAVYYWVRQKRVNRYTLEKNILRTQKNPMTLDAVCFLVPLITSLHILGFLFTISFLLIPTLIAGTIFRSEKLATITLMAIAAASSASGLFLSIYFDNISTTAAQVTLLVAFLVLIRLKAILTRLRVE